jgi:hypothetical protein
MMSVAVTTAANLLQHLPAAAVLALPEDALGGGHAIVGEALRWHDNIVTRSRGPEDARRGGIAHRGGSSADGDW